MNDSERRRRNLLNQARSLYSERQGIPAIHPRYRGSYAQLYEEVPETPGTFGLRIVLCLLAFSAFVMIDYGKAEMVDVSSNQIIQAVKEDIDIEEVWKNL